MTTQEDLWCQLNSSSSKTKMTYTLYLKVGSCDSFSDIWSSLGVRKFWEAPKLTKCWLHWLEQDASNYDLCEFDILWWDAKVRKQLISDSDFRGDCQYVLFYISQGSDFCLPRSWNIWQRYVLTSNLWPWQCWSKIQSQRETKSCSILTVLK